MNMQKMGVVGFAGLASVFLFSVLFLATPVFALDALGCNARGNCFVRDNVAINSGQVFYYRFFDLAPGATILVQPEPPSPAHPLGKGGSITIVADEIYIAGTINANGNNGGPRFGATSGQNGGAVHLIARRNLGLERSGRVTANGGNGAFLGCETGNGGTGGFIEIALVRGTWVTNSSTLSTAGGTGAPVPFGCAGPAGYNGMRGPVIWDFFTPSPSNLTILGPRARDVPVDANTTIDVVVRNEFNDVVTGNVTWYIDNPAIASVVFQNSTRAVINVLSPGSATISARLNTTNSRMLVSSVVVYGFSRDATNFSIIGDTFRRLAEGMNTTVNIVLVNELLGTPANGTVEWSVSNPAVIEIVSQNSTAAIVRALSVGDSFLFIRLIKPDGTFIQRHVDFNIVPGVARIMLAGADFRDLRSGISDTLTFNAVDGLGNPAVVTSSSWASSNSSVIEIVSQNATSAVVRGLKRGVARVTATVGPRSDYVTYNVQPGTFNHMVVAPAEVLQPTVTELSYGESLPEYLAPKVVGYDFGGNQVPIPLAQLRDIHVEVTPESEGNLTIVKRIDEALGVLRVRVTAGSKPGLATVRISQHGMSVDVLFNVTMPLSAVRTVSLTPNRPTLFIGENITFTAVGVDEDGDEAPFPIEWSAFNVTGKGVIDENGTFTAIDDGTVFIIVHVVGTPITLSAGVVTIVDPISLIDSIKITPARPLIVTGSDVQFEAFAVYENETEAPIAAEWRVANLSGSGIIDEGGLFTARRPGNVIVSAKMVGGVDLFGSTEVTIVNYYSNVRSIRLSPMFETIAAGDILVFEVVGIDGDGFEVDIAPEWEVGNFTGGAVVTQDGVLTALRTGTVFVTARLPGRGIATTATIQIVSASPQRVVLSGPTGAVSGESLNFTARVVDENGNTVFAIDREDVQFIWSASSGRIYQNGTFIASRSGTVTISAYVAGHSSIRGSKTVIVTSDEPATSLRINDVGEIPAGAPYRLSAQLLDRYGDVVDDDASAVWSLLSGDATITGNTVTPRGLGAVVVQAVSSINASLNDTATFRVVSGRATSIEIDPTNVEVRVDDEVEFRVVRAVDAAGNVFHPDANDVEWSVSNSNVGDIDSGGFFTALAPGIVRVTATLQGGSASATVKVTESLRGRSTRFAGRVSVPSTLAAPQLPARVSSTASPTATTSSSAAPSGATGLFTASGLGEGDYTLLLMVGFGILIIGLGAYLLVSRG